MLFLLSLLVRGTSPGEGEGRPKHGVRLPVVWSGGVHGRVVPSIAASGRSAPAGAELCIVKICEGIPLGVESDVSTSGTLYETLGHFWDFVRDFGTLG